MQPRAWRAMARRALPKRGFVGIQWAESDADRFRTMNRVPVHHAGCLPFSVGPLAKHLCYILCMAKHSMQEECRPPATEHVCINIQLRDSLAFEMRDGHVVARWRSGPEERWEGSRDRTMGDPPGSGDQQASLGMRRCAFCG